MRRLFWVGLMAVGAVVACGAAQAQSDADGIKASLQGKPLILRGFWAGDKLEFDSAGQPIAKYKTVSFTLSGFEVTSVEAQGDRVEIAGRRVGLRLDKVPEERIPLNKMTITIDRKDGDDVGAALAAIFANGVREVAASLPEIWAGYARQYLPAEAQSNAVAAKPGADPKARPATMRPPTLIHAVDPKYTAEAQAKGITGNSQIFLWVDEAGLPSHVGIVRPLGMGLDEQAVDAVRQYRFKPAARDGKPVKVDLYIEVNFQMF